MDVRQRIRQRLIDIAFRHQRPGSGSSLILLRERTAEVKFPDLTPILHPIRWAVVGAVATRLYMPERVTRDLDILVHKEDSEEVRKKLKGAGFRYQSELAAGGSSWLSPDGVPVDVVERSEPWFARGIIEAQQNRDQQGLPILPLPYLVLMKFQSGRVQDIADVARMLGQASEDTLTAVRELFKRVQSADLEDLESLIKLGQLELRPPEAEG
ncbi:MAG TPA: hypothetical protein ACFYD3_05485 [Candidatus Hypogeohydataceae bacterium YC41]